MSIGSLFAGIGGFDLAAKWMGWRTAWVSEIDPYASAVLKKHFPDAPNHGDITQIKGEQVERVDILCGGFPCQDISLIGEGAGINGQRSGLWTHYARLIDEIRPQYVVAENVSALRSRGLDRVLRDLLALGYDAEWHCITASSVGAPHQRDRIWIVAYPQRKGLEGHAGNVGLIDESRWKQALTVGSVGSDGLRGGAGNRTDTESAGCGQGSVRTPGEDRLAERLGSEGREAPRQSYWSVEPDVGRVAHGIPSRVDRLRCLGNAIVPQVAHVLFQAIEDRERRLAA